MSEKKTIFTFEQYVDLRVPDHEGLNANVALNLHYTGHPLGPPKVSKEHLDAAYCMARTYRKRVRVAVLEDGQLVLLGEVTE